MRMGPHVMKAITPGTPARAMYEEYVTKVRPDVVKFCRQSLDNGLLAWTRAQGSKTLARYVDVALTSSGAENARLADRVLNELLPFATHLDYVEFANEEWQGKEDPRDWDKLMQACGVFMAKLDAANKAAGRAGPKACIANVSVGQPELERWTRESTREVARYAAVNGHAWGIHEYYKPDPWAMVEGGKAVWDGAPAAEGWLMLRCMKVVKIFRGLNIPFRFIVTESGRDNVPGQPGLGGGFRDVPGEPYAEYMVQYGRHLSAIPECVGWVDFGYNAWTGWTQFDLTLDPAMHARFVALMPALPRGAPAPPAPPTPTPPPGGDPVSDRLSTLLADELGGAYEDLRRALPVNPGGPNGPFGRLDLARVDGIAVHHTAGPKAATWQTIAADHISRRGWAGIGYHIGIRLGRVALLGDITTARAHVADENDHLIGVVLAGNYQIDPLDARDHDALRRVIAVLDRLLGRNVRVGGHREFSPPGHTVCPGGALAAVLPGIRGEAPTPAPAIDVRRLWTEAASNQAIRLNPGAGLQRAILAAGMVPTSNEWQHSPRHVAQRGESPTGGRAAVFVYDKTTGKITRYDATSA